MSAFGSKADVLVTFANDAIDRCCRKRLENIDEQ